MVMEWYELAKESLLSRLENDENLVVYGDQFLRDYFYENPPSDFEEEEEEQDRYLIENIDVFEKWLSTECSDKITIDEDYRWSSIRKVVDKKNIIQLTRFKLNEDQVKLLNKPLDKIDSDIAKEILMFYPDLVNADDFKNSYLAAIRIATGYDHSDFSFREKSGFWELAGDRAKEDNKKNSAELYVNAAQKMKQIFEHSEAARLYDKAVDSAKTCNIEKDELLNLVRNCWKQYEAAGLEIEASLMYVKEKELIREYADTKWKRILMYFYKGLSNYGESPLRVLGWGTLIILLCAVLYFVFGLNIPKSEDVSVLAYLYYSVVTFTTLGYGDFSPLVGVSRFISAAQAILGLFFTSLFLVTFVRKFSR